ncbi:MAG: 5'-methylthioadenosine/adenosylhomocysteine nucleosidase [Oscillospiraceae bacterium]|jgi:adenosylhomocysteine nucleosidase|nr:5'-methylthioadenosine/adenosylhomocysteine nucleosidase [Oscillospiraceae bacterium]
MNIVGIIGAMDAEIASLKNELENPRNKTVMGIEFVSGKLEGRDVVVAKCGMGKVQAAMCATIMINDFNAAKLINTGVGGAVYQKLLIGDVVVSSDTCLHDVDLTAIGEPLGKLPNLNTVNFPADKVLIGLAVSAGENVLREHNVHVGVIATGDQFIASKAKKDFIRDNFGAYAADMEGGAIGEVCHLNKIPYVVIRAVSDNADEAAGGDFMFSVDETAQSSAAIVREMLKNLG